MSQDAPYKSVLRALEVLELIGATYNGLGLKEIIDRLRINETGSLHKLLYALVDKGYLVRLEHPIRYKIGPALGVIDRMHMINSLYQRISPVMSSICLQSGMKITYQQFVADRGLVLFCVNPKTYHSVFITDYPNLPYGTFVIFQAYMTPEEQDKFWAANPMSQIDRKIWGNFENLRKYLKTVVKQRLAVIAPQQGQPFRVSGPIFDSSGKVSAAISAIQIDSKLTQEQANTAARLVHQAAIELSEHEPPEISIGRMPA